MNIDDTDYALSSEPIENPYASGVSIGYNLGNERVFFFTNTPSVSKLPGQSYGIGLGILDFDLLSILRPGQYTQQRCDKNSFPYNSLDFPGIGVNRSFFGGSLPIVFNEFQSFSAVRQLKYNFNQFLEEGLIDGFINKANEIFNKEPLTFFYYGKESGTGLNDIFSVATNSAYPFEQASGTTPSFNIFPSGTVDKDNAFGFRPQPFSSGLYTVLHPSTAILLPLTQIGKVVLDMQQHLQRMYDNPKYPSKVTNYDWNYAIHPSWNGDEGTLNLQLLANGNSSFNDKAFRFETPLSYHEIYRFNHPVKSCLCDVLSDSPQIPIPGMSLQKTLQLANIDVGASGWYTFDDYDNRGVSIEKSNNNYTIPRASGGALYTAAINQINIHRAHYRNLWASQLNYPSGVNLKFNSRTELGSQYNMYNAGASGMVPNGSWDNNIPSGITDIEIPTMEFIKTEWNFANLGDNTSTDTYSIGYDFNTTNNIMLVDIYDRFGEHYTLPSGLIHYNIYPYLTSFITSLTEYGYFGQPSPYDSNIRFNVISGSGLIHTGINPNKIISRFYNRLPHVTDFKESTVFRALIYNTFGKFGGITPHTIPHNEKVENLFVHRLNNTASISGLFWIENDRTKNRVFELSTDEIYNSPASGHVKLDIFTSNPTGNPIIDTTLRYDSQPESNVNTKMLNPWNTGWTSNNALFYLIIDNFSVDDIHNSSWHVNQVIASGAVRIDVRFYKTALHTFYITPGDMLLTVKNKKGETLYEVPTFGTLNSDQIASGLATVPDPVFGTNSNTVSMLLPFVWNINALFTNQFIDTGLTYPDENNPRLPGFGRTFYLVGQDYYNYRGLSGVLEVLHPGTDTNITTGITYSDLGLSANLLNLTLFTKVGTKSSNFYAPNKNEFAIFDLGSVDISTGNDTTYTEVCGVPITGNYNVADKYWPD